MVAPALRPLTNSQYQVTLSTDSGGPYYFTTFSGIKDNAQTSTYADGVSNIIYSLRGPRQLQQVTLSAPFSPSTHKSLIEWWKAYTCESVTIEIKVVDCNGRPVDSAADGMTITVYDAQVTQLNFAQVDRTSSNVSMLELGFVCNYFDIE